MNTKFNRFAPHPVGERDFRSRTAAWIAAVALCVCTAARLDAVVIDDFEGGVNYGPGSGAGYTNYFLWGITNGELVIQRPYPTPFPPYPETMATYDNIYWPAPRFPNNCLEDGRTLEIRMDLIQTSADDLFCMPVCGGTYEGAGTLYWAFVDRNEVALVKYRYDSNDPSRNHITTFYWDIVEATFENVTVKMAFTKTNSSSLAITVKVVDKGNQGATLYERTFVDGPNQDGPLPPPDPHNYGFFTADQGVPYPAFSYAALGCSHTITKIPLPPLLEMRVDNVEYDVYDPPSLDIANSVLLSWPANTEKEQVVVGADSPTGPVWTPWPEPIFKRFGQMCMTVPTTATQQYFKLVPGTQFADDFSDCSGPFTNRSPWVPLFQDPGEEWVVTNGVLQLKCNPPTGGTALCPLGTNEEAYLRDSYMSVDILDWVASATTKSGFSLNARARMVSTGGATTYMGGLTHNHDGIPGKVRPWIWNGSEYIRGTDFYLQDYPLPYRLQFSVVGPRLQLQGIRVGKAV